MASSCLRSINEHRHLEALTFARDSRWLLCTEVRGADLNCLALTVREAVLRVCVPLFGLWLMRHEWFGMGENKDWIRWGCGWR